MIKKKILKLSVKPIKYHCQGTGTGIQQLGSDHSGKKPGQARGEEEGDYWALISNNWQYLQENFISGRFSFSSDPRLGGKRKQ